MWPRAKLLLPLKVATTLLRTTTTQLSGNYRSVRNAVAILNRNVARDRNVIAAQSGNNISNPVLDKCYCYFFSKNAFFGTKNAFFSTENAFFSTENAIF